MKLLFMFSLLMIVQSEVLAHDPTSECILDWLRMHNSGLQIIASNHSLEQAIHVLNENMDNPFEVIKSIRIFLNKVSLTLDQHTEYINKSSDFEMCLIQSHLESHHK